MGARLANKRILLSIYVPEPMHALVLQYARHRDMSRSQAAMMILDAGLQSKLVAPYITAPVIETDAPEPPQPLDPSRFNYDPEPDLHRGAEWSRDTTGDERRRGIMWSIEPPRKSGQWPLQQFELLRRGIRPNARLKAAGRYLAPNPNWPGLEFDLCWYKAGEYLVPPQTLTTLEGIELPEGVTPEQMLAPKPPV
jgi:hypothetical protein